MEPELDVITNGRDRQAPRPRTNGPDQATAPADPTRPVTRRRPGLRWAGPVVAVLLLAAVAVFVATRPDRGIDPVAAPPTTTPVPARHSPSFAPPPKPDNRPQASAAQSLFADAQRALGPAGQAGAAMIELIGSDYRGGWATIGVFGQQLQGTVAVDLACAGTGTARVWIQDQNPASGDGPSTLLDCANPRPTRLTSTISDAGFFVYADLDPNTVAVLAYLPMVSISVEDHGF